MINFFHHNQRSSFDISEHKCNVVVPNEPLERINVGILGCHRVHNREEVIKLRIV